MGRFLRFDIQDPVLINGAGSLKHHKDAASFAHTNLPIITIGSYTEPQREGNKGKTL